MNLSMRLLLFFCTVMVAHNSLHSMDHDDPFFGNQQPNYGYRGNRHNHNDHETKRFRRPFLDRNSGKITAVLAAIVAGAIGWKLFSVGTDYYKNKKLESLLTEFDDFIHAFKKKYDRLLTTCNKVYTSSSAEKYTALTAITVDINFKDHSPKGVVKDDALKILHAALKINLKTIDAHKQKVVELEIEESDQAVALLEKISSWHDEIEKIITLITPLRIYQDATTLLSAFEKKYMHPIHMIASLHEPLQLRKMLTENSPIILAFDFAQQVETDLAQIKQSCQLLRDIKSDVFYDSVQKKLEYYQDQLATLQRIVKKSYEYNLEERYLREIRKLKESLSRHESQINGLESSTIMLQRPSSTPTTGGLK